MNDWIATDLDSTLFHRSWAEKDAVAATWRFEGDQARKPSSWMRRETYCLLEVLGRSFTLVPVTARDQESFSRVEIRGINLRCPAVIANGAIILGWDGQPDPIWQDVILKVLSPWENKLEDYCNTLAERSIGFARPRLVTGPEGLPAYLVAKAEPGWWFTSPGQALISEINWLECRVEILGDELQILPPGISKLSATLEIQNRFFSGRSPLLCMGDMPLDLEFMRLGGLLATPKDSTLDQLW